MSTNEYIDSHGFVYFRIEHNIYRYHPTIVHTAGTADMSPVGDMETNYQWLDPDGKQWWDIFFNDKKDPVIRTPLSKEELFAELI